MSAVSFSVVSVTGLLSFFITFNLHMYLFEPDFAIILQLPAFFAVTFPLLVTVAIFLSELDHFIVFLLPVTLRVAASPSSSVGICCAVGKGLKC